MTFDLGAAFKHKQQALSLVLSSVDMISHPTNKGDISESSWRRLLSQTLPARYGVSKATIVDSSGGQSRAIDIVIHDKHFSPLVFEQEGVIYLPAESVYAVFEVKQDLTKDNMEYAATFAESVRVLTRTSAKIVHAGGKIQEPKAPPEIIAGLLTSRAGWNPALGEAFREHLHLEGLGRLDLGCVVSSGAWEIHSDSNGEVRTVGEEESLIFFVLRLLARLQAMGTVSAMDYEIWGASLGPT